MVDAMALPGLGSVSTKRLKLELMAADTLTRVFSALADPTRRDIVTRLAEGDATVGQLAEPYRMTVQAIYKHLRVMEDAGLVSRPQGPQPRSVRLETGVLSEMETWIERYRRRAEQRYRRLDAVLATMSPADEEDGADDVNDHADGHRG
jgi:DNA-binding transcriptional ArsR family regulator